MFYICTKSLRQIPSNVKLHLHGNEYDSDSDFGVLFMSFWLLVLGGG